MSPVIIGALGGARSIPEVPGNIPEVHRVEGSSTIMSRVVGTCLPPRGGTTQPGSFSGSFSLPSIRRCPACADSSPSSGYRPAGSPARQDQPICSALFTQLPPLGQGCSEGGQDERLGSPIAGDMVDISTQQKPMHGLRQSQPHLSPAGFSCRPAKLPACLSPCSTQLSLCSSA